MSNQTIIKRGTRVRIPKGTLLRSTHPQRDGYYPAGRTYNVEVHHVNEGTSLCPIMHSKELRRIAAIDERVREEYAHWLVMRDSPNKTAEDYVKLENFSIRTRPPSVMWSGAGGYWVWAAVEDVEIVEQEDAA